MSTAKVRSLRFRLIVATLSAISIVWIALSIAAWFEATAEVDILFDQHLGEFATLMAGLVSENATQEIAEHLEQPGFIPNITTQVWSKAGKLLFRTGDAPEQRLSAVEEGLSNSSSGGQQWRVFSKWDGSRDYLVQVAETTKTRESIKNELVNHLLLPIIAALPLLAGALIWLIGANLAPLSRLAESISQRSPERLDAIPLSEAPQELHPILDQLNRLFTRVDQSFEKERRFTADAAHELRTPLAAMHTHAQVARDSKEDAQRERSLDCLIEASERTTRLVEQLLTMARVDATTMGDRFVAVDLREAAAAALSMEAPLAFAKSMDLVLEEGSAAIVQGNPVLLTMLLRNLIDNAVRYSPAGTSVAVSTKLGSGAVVLEVIDSGPGIAAAERARVLERFTRIEGNQETGSGLGLSIVARIVELHCAHLELDAGTAGAGLCVRVTFPS